jgi:hypothetical protein
MVLLSSELVLLVLILSLITCDSVSVVTEDLDGDKVRGFLAWATGKAA